MLYYIASYVKSFWLLLNDAPLGMHLVMAGLTGLVSSLIFGYWFIAALQHLFKSATREWLPERHKEKGIMPTMGGIFIGAAVFVSALLWTTVCKPQVWIFLITLTGFGLIGCYDDWCKIRYQRGMTASLKIRLQWLMAGLVSFLLVIWQGVATTVVLPFFKNATIPLGPLFIAWVMFIIVGTSNAVNLTDGLDGLAIGSLIPNFAIFGLIGYYVASGHLIRVAVPTDMVELSILAVIMVGACLGFWWYNRYPARIFMGDVGSLSLGACLAVLAIMAKLEVLLVVTGIVFVVEVLSVIAQVLSFKYSGKRIFKMAPIHHHFELVGWSEKTIVWYFTALSCLMCYGVFILIKMR